MNIVGEQADEVLFEQPGELASRTKMRTGAGQETE
jgi:hypothetical protein